ncbi:MAG: hypothetical protein D6698_07445 [Gammaproteobacteria bacterium]|nr:MAG: hypothetical protein D6698_07445 [Gammaproteobacteria bacterium]
METRLKNLKEALTRANEQLEHMIYRYQTYQSSNKEGTYEAAEHEIDIFPRMIEPGVRLQVVSVPSEYIPHATIAVMFIESYKQTSWRYLPYRVQHLLVRGSMFVETESGERRLLEPEDTLTVPAWTRFRIETRQPTSCILVLKPPVKPLRLDEEEGAEHSVAG